MNEVQFTGKVLNIYEDSRTHNIVCKTSVPHEHKVGNQSITVESIFKRIVADDDCKRKVYIQKGDYVKLKGYLKQDITMSPTGNTHERNMVYVKELQLTA